MLGFISEVGVGGLTLGGGLGYLTRRFGGTLVTRFTFRLHGVGPTVYGGLIA